MKSNSNALPLFLPIHLTNLVFFLSSTLRERIRALRHAEIYVLDESNNIEQMNAERIPTIWDEGGYQVVNSYVPLRDNYRIDTRMIRFLRLASN